MTDPKVAAQVRRYLADERGPLKALALALARRLDDPETTGVAAVARELRATLREIDLEHITGELPGDEEGDDAETEEVDPVADLAARRERRRRAAAEGL